MRVRVSAQHRKKIADLLEAHADDKALKVYQGMSMHSCHFTHIAMVIWTMAHEEAVAEATLAKDWQTILLNYAKCKYATADKAGETLLRALVNHGAFMLNMKPLALIQKLHPLDQNKMSQVGYGG